METIKEHFAIRVRPCKLEPKRLRWEILRDGQLVATSDESYADFGPAMAAAKLARVKIIDRAFRA